MRLNQRLLKFWVLGVVLAVSALAAGVLLWWRSPQGTVQVRSEPSGATVYINDKKQPRKTEAEFDLKAGKYTLRVELEGYEPEVRKVEVAAGNVAQEVFQLERVDTSKYRPVDASKYRPVEITSTPTGATVFIDGRRQAKKTPAEFRVRIGKHRVKLVCPGCEPKEDDLLVEPQYESQNFYLRLEPTAPDGPD